MIGDWTGSVTVSSEGSDIQMACTVKVEWVSKNNFIRTTMSVALPDDVGKAESVSYVSYDADAQLYRAYVFQDTSPLAREESGTFDGTKLVLTGKAWAPAPGKPKQVFRTTCRQTADGLSMLTELKQGDSWTKVGEGTFKKAAASGG
jgi:hypothetical protein